LFNLQKAHFTNTSMACSGIIRPYNVTTNASCSNPDYCKTPQTFGDTATAQMFCSDKQVLPCFLRFSDEQLPLDDASNMRCRYILRKLPEQAKQDCAAAEGMYGLGEDADGAMPDIIRDAQQQQWMLDPMYFQYRGCSCLTVSNAAAVAAETAVSGFVIATAPRAVATVIVVCVALCAAAACLLHIRCCRMPNASLACACLLPMPCCISTLDSFSWDDPSWCCALRPFLQRIGCKFGKLSPPLSPMHAA
jgi:hypothetical protein